MKKHQDGYVLVFVLVVIAAVTIFVMADASVALQNYKNQNNNLLRMQWHYDLIGKLELVDIETSAFTYDMTAPSPTASDEERRTEIIDGLKIGLKQYKDGGHDMDFEVEPDIKVVSSDGAEDTFYYLIDYKTDHDQALIEVPFEKTESINKYTWKLGKATYSDYKIGAPDEEGGGT